MPKGDFGNKRNTKGFDSEPANINKNGRPRKLISNLIKELELQGVERVSPSQINDIISIFLNLSRSEIATLANDSEQPIYIRVIARKLTATSDDKLFETLEKLLDRGHGKPTQRTELTGKDGDAIKVDTMPVIPLTLSQPKQE